MWGERWEQAVVTAAGAGDSAILTWEGLTGKAKGKKWRMSRCQPWEEHEKMWVYLMWVRVYSFQVWAVCGNAISFTPPGCEARLYM